jgi:hypothetical protein
MVIAEVEASSDGAWAPVTSGTLTVVVWFEDAPGRESALDAAFLGDGRFRAVLDREMLDQIEARRVRGEAIFAGAGLLALCRSGEVVL